MLATAPDDRQVVVLSRIGRDETAACIEEAWGSFANKRLVAAHRRRREAWAQEPAVTRDDIRRVILALPGAVEGPIWGSTIGFLIGTEKKSQFARFGPGVGNLLPPDDEDALVILRCDQRPALLATRPDRYFITPHYGAPDEPGAVITRLSEHRGASDLEELAELLEDAWREVATPELRAELEGAGKQRTIPVGSEG